MNVVEGILDALNKITKRLNRLEAQGSGRFIGLGTTARPVLTSTSYDGDAFSTTAKTLIDLSAVFGVPGGVKAVLLYVAVRDAASAASDCRMYLGPNNTAYSGAPANCEPVNDRPGRYMLMVPCDANGDIYYEIYASGAGTFDAWIQVFGYWL